MTWNLRRTNLKFLWVLLLYFIASGCAPIPVGKYDVLAESSQSILNGTSETYTRIEKLQRRFSVETAPDTALDKNSFKPIIEGESFDLAPELHFREDALQVLVKYSIVLQAFAKRDFEGDVDKAAEELSGSLKSLATTAASNNNNAPKTSGILATAVDIVGRAIVRKERLDTLREVMSKSQADIDKLALLIEGSNEKINAFVNKMRDGILVHRKALRPTTGTINRVNFDTDVSLVIAEVDEINGALNGLSEAMKQVPPAHAEIRKMLDENPKGLNALQQLSAEAQHIDKFYRTVK